jgi:hypothetical protein
MSKKIWNSRKDYVKQYYIKNKEKCKQYKIINSEKIHQYHKQYDIKNKELIKKKNLERYHANKIKYKEQAKKYYLEHKEQRKKQAKQWRNKNKIKQLKYIQKRVKLKQNINQLERNSWSYYIWRQLIYKKDNWTCQICKTNKCKVYAHHIKPWKDYLELRFNTDNGITVCKNCHTKIHNGELECQQKNK